MATEAYSTVSSGCPHIMHGLNGKKASRLGTGTRKPLLKSQPCNMGGQRSMTWSVQIFLLVASVVFLNFFYREPLQDHSSSRRLLLRHQNEPDHQPIPTKLATNTTQQQLKTRIVNNNITKPEPTKVVSLQPNEIFFWQGRQAKLCRHIRQELEQEKAFEEEEEEGVVVTPRKLVLSLKIPCDAIHYEQRHGNYILGFYGMQLAAMAYNVTNFFFQCSSNSKLTTSNLFWWLQSVRPNSSIVPPGLFDPPIPIPDEACRGMGKAPLHYTSELIRNDLRQMAIRIFGAREELQAYLQLQQQQDPHLTTTDAPPLFPDTPLDEVAIHFRCGDILGNLPKKLDNYGLIPFRSYTDRIRQNTKSIGIVTAPFHDPRQLRRQDAAHGPSCQRLVQELQLFLSSKFPNAVVTIRNDPNDTIPMVYSRLILTKQTFCVGSTFCLFPAIASFGTAYIQEGGVAYFVPPIANVYPNIVLMKNDNGKHHLPSRKIHQKGLESTIRWLKKS